MPQKDLLVLLTLVVMTLTPAASHQFMNIMLRPGDFELLANTNTSPYRTKALCVFACTFIHSNQCKAFVFDSSSQICTLGKPKGPGPVYGEVGRIPAAAASLQVSVSSSLVFIEDVLFLVTASNNLNRASAVDRPDFPASDLMNIPPYPNDKPLFTAPYGKGIVACGSINDYWWAGHCYTLGYSSTDPATLTWTKVTENPSLSKHGWGSGALVGNRVYLWTGKTGATSATYISDCEWYDLSGGTDWQICDNLPVATIWGVGASAEGDNRVFHFGGTHSIHLGDTMVYDPSADEWTNLMAQPLPVGASDSNARKRFSCVQPTSSSRELFCVSALTGEACRFDLEELAWVGGTSDAPGSGDALPTDFLASMGRMATWNGRIFMAMSDNNVYEYDGSRPAGNRWALVTGADQHYQAVVAMTKPFAVISP